MMYVYVCTWCMFMYMFLCVCVCVVPSIYKKSTKINVDFLLGGQDIRLQIACIMVCTLSTSKCAKFAGKVRNDVILRKKVRGLRHMMKKRAYIPKQFKTV